MLGVVNRGSTDCHIPIGVYCPFMVEDQEFSAHLRFAKMPRIPKDKTLKLLAAAVVFTISDLGNGAAGAECLSKAPIFRGLLHGPWRICCSMISRTVVGPIAS